MDAPAPQSWGLGLRARMKTPPPSFIIFFPARDHPTLPNANCTTAQLSVGKVQSSISWGSNLVAPRPIYRLPAWHRVPVEAFPGKDGAESTRIIMKRIFHPNPRFTQRPTPQAACAQVSATKEAAKWTMVDSLELPCAKARRRDSYKASDALYEAFGAPQSAAEMAQIYLTAKVDIVNGMLQIPRSILKKEVTALRSLKRTRGVAPMKRRIDKHNCIETNGLYGGYRIESYDQLMPIIMKASELGEVPIDVLSASIAEISANFARTGRRNPRRRITLQGIPLLPDIIDRPELKNEVSLVLVHGGSAAKSPTKRSPQLAHPLKATPRRLSDTVVKLVPAGNPTIEPSPVKSPATPSTPFVNTPSRVVDDTTCRLGNSVSPNPLVFTSNKTPSVTPGPTLTFQPPSYQDSSSSSLFQSMDDLSPNKTLQLDSPTKFFSPLSPPSTDAQVPVFTSSAPLANPSQQINASEDISELGLVASIPAAATPKQESSSFRPIWPSDISQIKFAPIAPLFDSSNWLSSGITTRPKRGMKKTSRRKSEPLIRKCYKEQAARRQTISPNHLVFRGDVIFDTLEAPTQAGKVDSTSVKKSEHLDMTQTPDQAESSEPMLSFVTPAISWGRMTGRVSGDAVTPFRNCAAPTNGVHTVDMRQNLDIFGASALSTMPGPTAVDVLAGIARERCDGQANVMISEDNGRLIVRFKLPTEFAHLFPNNQGEDESHFTVTPSAISSSPRIDFHGHEQNNVAFSGPADQAQSGSSGIQGDDDQTLVMSDFSTSPVFHSFASATGSISRLGHTPTISKLGIATSPAQPKLETPTKQPEPATAQKDENPASNRTPSPTLNLSFTPVNPSSPRSLSPDGAAHQEPHDSKIDQSLTRQDQHPLESKPYDDSPGRDYMRDFIKRTNRKRLSTTETGSPIALPLERMPLGVKSSNTPSPQKVKRKAEGDIPNADFDTKTTPGPELKKARRSDRLGSHLSATDSQTKEPATRDKTSKVAPIVNAVAHAAHTCDDQEDHGEIVIGPGTRRSTRIRSQKPISGAAIKSSIPTAIKLGSRPGTGRLNSTTRTDQQDLSHKTRMNTRKNKGNAEYPAQVLARYQEERLGDGVSEGSSESESLGKPNTGGKNVGWKSPLEARQEEKPKKARTTATYKSKASGIAKPPKPATTTQKQQRTAKVAATLGMSQNGTPAKPYRATRSSTRVRV
ncbi:hypothetical protein C2857_007663 [Epichloe festucae Fl1]|uniref:Uncharacterized protein n=1 Tax=Epichloe festucae (strain Fl1) TaxID=877507 RepID=A0A7S9KQY7_EPIFF|nr:hypothetical protein C2857_007663 [Epichloe festucae Fl1]